MASNFRKDPEDAAISSGHLMEAIVTPPSQVNGNCDSNCHFGVKSSLRRRRSRRNVTDYCELDRSSEDDLELEKPVKTLQLKRTRQANDIRGTIPNSACEEISGNENLPNSACEEVTARWFPGEACRPIIDEAPVFYPNEEEFKDTLGYIASIRTHAEKFGICRIVPPPSWKPPCPLKEKHFWENAKFSTRVQQVEKLQNREPMRKRTRNRCQRKKKRRKQFRFGMTRRRNNCSTTETNEYVSDTDEKFGFQSGSDFTLQTFQIYADDFKEQYFGMRDTGDNKTNCKDETGEKWQPSVEEIEGEYWRIVQNPSDEVDVLYGADLETGTFGSGFPKANSTTAKELNPHVYSGWNLNNFPRLPGSVLSFESGDISGVVVPWLYIGMCFSSFCWHVEDHHLYSLNYLHWGDPKIWYGVPNNDAVKLEEAMRKNLPELFEEQPGLLHELVTQLSPSVLKSEGVPVYRVKQKAGEFVLTFPRAYHSGFNCGFNCAEAVNVAPMDWLPHGQIAVDLYSKQRRKTSISHDKLLMGAAREAVRALWELLFLGSRNPSNLYWESICGKEGILTKSIRARVSMEQKRRETCDFSNAKKMDREFDSSNEKECFFCFYDLHLSAAGCECSLDRFACLSHSDLLCSCEPVRRFFLFRYGMDESNSLVEALEGCSSAVQHWGSCYLGLVLPSNITTNKVPECLKVEHESLSEVVLENKSSPSKKGIIDLNSATVDISSQKTSVQMSELNSSTCTQATKAVFDLTEKSKSLNYCASEVDGASLQRIDLNRCADINPDLAAPEDTKLRCGRINLKKNGKLLTGNGCKEKPQWCLDLNEEDFFKNSKARDQGWSSKNSQDMVDIKNEQDFNSDVLNQEKSLLVVTDGCPERKPEMEFESMSASDSQLRPSPEGGSLGFPETSLDLFPLDAFQDSSARNKASSSKDSNKTCHFSVKLFGIDLHHQSFLQTNSYCEGSQFLNKHSPSSIASNQHNLEIKRNSSRSKYTVELLQLGAVMLGKQWCNSEAIFPKGFRSRVRYFSILDPTLACSYISEVVDAGLIGPLFKVTLEDSPEDTFMHSSPSLCWDLVRERVNQEIMKQCSLGNQELPPFQPPGSINGLEMFGFLSPSIIQIIESLDQYHGCMEYWALKKKIPVRFGTMDCSRSHEELHGSKTTKSETINSVSDDEIRHVLGPLFHKASPEELQVMHRVFRSAPDSDCWQVAYSVLQSVVEKTVHK